MPWEWPVGAACAFLVALITTPAGVSGAVLLLPVQLSVLGVPSPAVTPTNLLFNVSAVPGGLLRFARERRLVSPLTVLLVAGSLPGVIAGSVIRVQWLSDDRAFLFVAAGVLLPLGLWLLLGAQRIPAHPRETEMTPRARAAICATALVVGTLGGIYGIGGGSLLAPLLLAVGFSAYQVLQLTHGGAIAPDWALGVWLGAGGFAGSYLGARLQRHVPEAGLRRLLGLVACLVAARYLQEATRHVAERPAAVTVPVLGRP